MFNLFSASPDIFLHKETKGRKSQQKIFLKTTAIFTVIFPIVKYHAENPTETAMII